MPTTATLDNGLRIAVEKMPGVRSAGIAWLVPAGLSSEPETLPGLASITEEMLQRGSGGRDSRAIADALDTAGASRSISLGDRYTTVGCTCLGSRLGETLPLLADTVMSPRFDDDAFSPSQELAMASVASLQDEPRDRAAIAVKAAHEPAPWNRSRYGTEAGIRAATSDAVRAWWADRAVPEGSILALAGDVDPEEAIELARSLTEGWAGSASVGKISGKGERGYHHIEDESNQVQVFLLHDAPPAEDEQAALRERIVVQVLSGGMSARLFTEVREKRGLCYTVSAGYRASIGQGSVQAYVGTTPERAQESLDVLSAELARIGTDAGAIDEDEFERAKVGMKAGVVFHTESTSARAVALASDWDRLGRVRSLEEITEAIDGATLESVRAHAAGRSIERCTIQTLGPSPLNPPASCTGMRA